jgi:pSer/pThr/pTyr-binding forkhead associated (FHA) protein/RNA polymerase subunit RPABC4/transcription elongation factor Spt4
MPDNRCKFCGNLIGPDQKHCRVCGKSPGEMGEPFVRCSKGHIVTDGAEFCPWCGELVKQAQVTQNTENRTVQMTEQMTNNVTYETDRKTIRIPSTDTLKFNGGEDRTVVMRPGGKKDGPPRGRIVGFLVSYTISPSGKFYTLYEGRETIGRKNTTICIDDTQLSSEHAVLLHRNGRFIFEDRLSTNGSKVNGRDVLGQIDLNHGDVLEMGSHIYILVSIPQSPNMDRRVYLEIPQNDA